MSNLPINPEEHIENATEQQKESIESTNPGGGGTSSGSGNSPGSNPGGN